jgi:tRNA uridine 5-carboxymethylaminomethyl modification enzyme
LAELLKRPEVNYQSLLSLNAGQWRSAELGDVAPEPVSFAGQVAEQVQISLKYAGYIDRQKDEVDRAAHHESTKLPADLDYTQVAGLSMEVRQKLAKFKPETLGAASRMSGVTPAAVSLLLIHLRKGTLREAATPNTQGA